MIEKFYQADYIYNAGLVGFSRILKALEVPFTVSDKLEVDIDNLPPSTDILDTWLDLTSRVKIGNKPYWGKYDNQSKYYYYPNLSRSVLKKRIEEFITPPKMSKKARKCIYCGAPGVELDSGLGRAFFPSLKTQYTFFYSKDAICPRCAFILNCSHLAFAYYRPFDGCIFVNTPNLASSLEISDQLNALYLTDKKELLDVNLFMHIAQIWKKGFEIVFIRKSGMYFVKVLRIREDDLLILNDLDPNKLKIYGSIEFIENLVGGVKTYFYTEALRKVKEAANLKGLELIYKISDAFFFLDTIIKKEGSKMINTKLYYEIIKTISQQPSVITEEIADHAHTLISKINAGDLESVSSIIAKIYASKNIPIPDPIINLFGLEDISSFKIMALAMVMGALRGKERANKKEE